MVLAAIQISTIPWYPPVFSLNGKPQTKKASGGAELQHWSPLNLKTLSHFGDVAVKSVHSVADFLVSVLGSFAGFRESGIPYTVVSVPTISSKCLVQGLGVSV